MIFKFGDDFFSAFVFIITNHWSHQIMTEKTGIIRNNKG